MAEQKSPAVTEDFFDLYERHPHGIKILYHGIQIVIFKIFGYSLFTARLSSLLAGAGGIFCLYRILEGLVPQKNRFISFLVCIIFSWDIQFLYASHLARQEIYILLFFLITINLYLRGRSHPKDNNFLLMGLICGGALGIHPNAFITALPLILLLLRDGIKARLSLKQGCFFLLTASLCVIFFTGLSFLFNLNFVHDYRSFGQTVGVSNTIDMKILGFFIFLKKIFHQLAGTYYLPNIKYIFLLSPLLLVLSLWDKTGKRCIIFFTLLGISLGLIIIGKYSPPSFLFFLVPFYLALSSSFHLLWDKGLLRIIPILIALLIIGLSLFQLVGEWKKENTHLESYYDNLSSCLPRGSTVLGGLILDYYLEEEGRIYDWRNLAFLKKQSVDSYFEERNIEYVVLSSEIPFIYQNRPTWNALYGNTANWYPQLELFLKEEAELIGEFSSPGYGTRIAPYRFNTKETTYIYQLSPTDSTRE
ncbi:MAG: glycosyltransferase family 39 protein [Spirochaetales bacterium]|nr:glycosyltransferase family 39 protein [Spirochaetales bacterium]